MSLISSFVSSIVDTSEVFTSGDLEQEGYSEIVISNSDTIALATSRHKSIISQRDGDQTAAGCDRNVTSTQMFSNHNLQINRVTSCLRIYNKKILFNSKHFYFENYKAK